MTKRFNGTINLDVRKSTPDWTPYEQPKAPDGAPNVLFIVWDDVGFGALEPFGGPIETPTLQRLCDGGLKYTQFHTTAICSSTRAALLTGRNHTTVGMACIAEAASGFPGSNGHMPPETATIAEVLSERGYNTYAVGKWHVVAEDETNMASSRRNWPTGRGFERFYGYLGGETNQWYPDLVQDQQMVDQPADPPKDWAAGFGDDDYHLSRDLVNRAISMIADAKQIAPDRPFFMHFCPGAGHAPHHAPKEWIDKYKGRFDEGYEAIRPSILANQKKLGMVPENTELSPINPLLGQKSVEGLPIADVDVVRPWDSLHEDEKAVMRRMAEVYAGFCSYTDHEIARLIDYLEQSGELDNTLIILLSDNGASGEGGPNGSVNENKIMNGVPDEMKDNLKYLDVLGSPATYNHYAIGWAFAFNTPNKMFKRHTWEGGSSDPMVVHWPAGIKAKGESRHQYTHVSDVVPTVYEALGIEPPEVVKGYAQWDLEGTSFKYSFGDAKAKTQKRSQYYVMLGTRAIWRDGWKANAVHAGTPSGWGHFADDRWELYHVDEDRSELHDLADKHPELLKELVDLWHYEAGRHFGLPLDDRTALEVLLTPRPQMVSPRDRYIYYPGTLEVPEAVAVSIRGRSYKIAAEVELTKSAAGVLFAHGAMFGGHALYIKDGKLKYIYSYLGEEEQVVVSDKPITAGKHVLGAEFTKDDATATATIGTVTLYIDDRAVGELKKVKTQLGKFSLCGEGLNIGRDGGAPVTDDYPGVRPWAFSGGTISRVIVDVSGEEYVDLEKEAWGMMERD